MITIYVTLNFDLLISWSLVNAYREIPCRSTFGVDSSSRLRIRARTTPQTDIHWQTETQSHMYTQLITYLYPRGRTGIGNFMTSVTVIIMLSSHLITIGLVRFCHTGSGAAWHGTRHGTALHGATRRGMRYRKVPPGAVSGVTEPLVYSFTP